MMPELNVGTSSCFAVKLSDTGGADDGGGSGTGGVVRWRRESSL